VVRDQHIERMLFYVRRIWELSLDFEEFDGTGLDLDIVSSIIKRLSKASAFCSLRKLGKKV